MQGAKTEDRNLTLSRRRYVENRSRPAQEGFHFVEGSTGGAGGRWIVAWRDRLGGPDIHHAARFHTGLAAG